MKHPEKLIAEPTRRTPWIVMEPGRIFVMGRSIPENPGEFYRSVYEWIVNHSRSFDEGIRIDVGFEYINTTSTKWIFSILRELTGKSELAGKVKVNWYYERGDDDMCELGYILKSLLDCPFFIIELRGMTKAGYETILAEPVLG